MAPVVRGGGRDGRAGCRGHVVAAASSDRDRGGEDDGARFRGPAARVQCLGAVEQGRTGESGAGGGRRALQARGRAGSERCRRVGGVVTGRLLGYLSQPRQRSATSRRSAQEGGAGVALNELGWDELINSDYRAAEAAVDASIALQPYWGNLGLKCLIARRWWGDLALAKATMDRIPAAARQDDIEVSEAVEIYYWRREPENMLRVLNSVPRDWLRSNTFDGPKAWWTALAQQMAGHDEAAQMQWRTALKLVERRLADQPDSGFLLRWKGLLLAASGNRSEGETALRLAREMGDGMIPIQEAIDQVRLGNLDAAITLLERAVELRLSYADRKS